MMYDLGRICSGKNIEPIESEDFAFEGCMLEVVKMLKKRQRNRENRKRSGAEEDVEKEEERRKNRKRNSEEEESGHELA